MIFIVWIAAVFISAVFLDSLRFKFTGHKTPKHIFKTLRDWSHIGLFYPAGPWIIGLGEALASILLLFAPIVLVLRHAPESVALSQFVGALIAIVIMTGAISFHLFSPLGTKTPTKWNGDVPVKSSPALFYSAIGCWICAAVLLSLRGAEVLA